MPPKRYRWVVAPLLAPLALAACGGSHTARGSLGPVTSTTAEAPTVATPEAATTTSTTTTSTTTTVATTTTTSVRPKAETTTTTAAPTITTKSTVAVAPFSDRVSAVTAADVPYTWRPGCPTPPSSLRMIDMSYWGFDGRAHTGSMVVNATVVNSVVTVFRTLYEKRFPIFEMVPEDAYKGDDNAAAAADDTSGFNCRDAVTSGPPQWSVHAYGEAIDVNDVQNPYVDGSTIIPPSGAAYLNRNDVRPGMAEPGGVLVEAFASVGWQWGGRWNPGTDYQHFSLTGG